MMKQFNKLLTGITLAVAPITLAGCNSKPRGNGNHECKKYPAGHITPSKPIPPKPKPPVPPKPKPDLPSDIKLVLINQTKQTPWDIVLKDLDYQFKPAGFESVTSKKNQTFLKTCLKCCLPSRKDAYFKNCHFEAIDQWGFVGAGRLNHLKLTGFKEEIAFGARIT